MANAMYAKGLEAFLKGQISWTNDDIYAVLVNFAQYEADPNYSLNFLSTHQFLSSIPSAARVRVDGPLAAKSATDGIARANNLTFAALNGAKCDAVVLFKDTGDENTSPLICYIDSASGLPVTPQGGDITVVWDTINGIFRL